MEVFKKLGDGKTVTIPIGFGEGLTAIHEEAIVSIFIAIYESINAVIEHTNAIQTKLLAAADFDAFKANCATTEIPSAKNTLSIEKGLRN